jgi:thiol-disulfide isomerase/thioredoxin
MRSAMIALAMAVVLLAAPASAAVRFAEWSGDEIGGLLAEAASADRLIMVVITQPDWCPGCIELDRTLLRNPEAQDIAALTANWVVLEVLGYDEPDASFLARQGLGFLGTPTTLLLSPRATDQRLGDARQVAAIVGFPADYMERLERAATGHDAIEEARARLRADNDVAALRGLADAFLAAGDATAARRVFQSLMLREELSAEEQRQVALQSILQPTQRIEKDHPRTLEELAAWAERFPGAQDDPDYVYGRVWSLLSLGRHDEAMELIEVAYLSGDPNALASYLYLVFRDPHDVLLADAEARAREAVTKFPEQAARFNSAHGRLLRRQGRLAEAELAFSRAVAAAAKDDPNLGTYRGQLEFVRAERAVPARGAG